jgi:chitodextrinase
MIRPRVFSSVLARLVSLLVLGLLVTVLLRGAPLQAATDISVCASGCDHSSIQAAINAAASGDTIVLAREVFVETIVVDRDLTIRGASSAASIIDGAAAGTVIVVPAGVSVTLESLTVRNGRTSGNGGGILNQGTLWASDIVVSSNVAATLPSSAGGGIYSTGQLTLVDSTLTANESYSGGGGLYVSGLTATALVERTNLVENRVHDMTTDFRGGGGIHVASADVTVRDSRIVGNRTDFTGGGVTVRGSSADVQIIDTTIDANISRLGVGVTLQTSARLTIRGSTISNNTGAAGTTSSGGGLRAGAPVTITNSTIFGNSATGSGGGILAESTVTLDSVTIAGNSSGFGGGIASFSAGTTLINNSIVFGNSATNFGHDCAGSLDGGTGLLIGDPADCTTAAVTDVLVADPLLGPLADNGGQTLTMLPATDSPAVDAGTTSLTADQRGEPRPAGGGPDLGSVEVQQEAEDTVAPHWTDATLVATTVSSRSFSIAWSGASDDVAVTAYEISLDGTVVETVPAPTTTASIGGVAPATRYVVNVQAIDAAGNRSADGPTTTVTTAPDLGGDHLLPRADDPSAVWQTQLPMGDIEAARRLGQIVIVASAGAGDPVLTFVDVAIPANIDIDGDGADDVQVSVDLAPGPGLIPAVVMTIDRLIAPGPEDVQIVAIAPLPDELSTALGKASLVTGVGTAAVDGGTGGHLPETETITASIDVIDGLDHRLGLDFATHNPLNPLVFYIGSAEGDGRDLGATGASLLGLQTSPVPSLVQLAFATQLPGVADPEPAARAVMEWRAPATEPDPDILFFYLESEGIPKGTAADYDTRVLVEDIDPETTVTLLLEPDDALEINIDHDDPSTFTVDRIDRIELQHTQNGLDVRAAIRDLPGPRLSIRLDDGTGDLVVTNQAFHFDLELEISRPGNSFFGDAFRNPVDWIYVSALDVRELTIGSGDGGGIAFAFTDGPADVVFVAADDPLNLRFPAEQDGEWPSGHPSQWPDEQRIVRVGLVDDDGGTTLAVHAADTRSFRVDFDAPSLGQKVGLESAHRVRLDVEAEIGPGPNAQVPTTLGCDAFLAPALTSFDISPPSQFSFVSGGGEALRCHAETGTRSMLASAAAFPAVATIGFDIDRTAGAISITAEDEFGDDDPLTFVRVTLTDVESGLTGDEPLGAPAELLAFAADELPSAAITWAHERGQDLDLVIESTAEENRIQDLKFLLATKADFFTEPFTPSFSQLLPVLERTGARPVFLARDALSVHVWELPEITLLAAAVDELRYLAATAAPDGETRLGMDITAPRPLVVELVLPLGRHFLPHIGIEGWCDFAVPDGTSGFDSRLPDSVSLVTSNPSGFESLQCRQHVQSDAPLNVNVLLDAHGIPDGTTVFTDLAAGRIGIDTRVSTIEDISVEVRDRSGEGLLAASPFAHPIGSLAMRADGVSALDAEWQLAEGMLDVELTARSAAEAVQFRASTQTQLDLLSEPGDHHHLLITDEGVSKGAGDTDDGEDEAGDGEVLVTVVGLLSAHVRHGANLSPLPLVIELETAASGPLVVDALLDFDSPLAPSLSPGTTAQIEATGRIDALSTSASYATNLAQLHQVSGAAAGADLWAHVVIDDDNTDEDSDEDPALEIFAVAQDLPAFFGLNAWDFMTSDAGTQAAFVELSSSMPLLDVVLRDPRFDGVRGSGSQRVRVRAEQIPQRVDFLIDDQLTDGTGSIAIDGRLSGRLGQLLIESNSFDPTGHPHFNTPFAQITAQLTDVPPDIRVLVHSDDATGSVSGEFVFGDGPIPATGPDADDRIGRVEVILERVARDLSEDRGLPLELYGDERFTSLTRSDFVRSVDDTYWASAPGVRARLGLVEQGFSLQTARIAAQPAADGEGPVERTMAVDDYVLVSQTRRGASSPLIALQLSNIHSLTFSSLQPDSRVDLVRPQSSGSPPLYIAFERVQPPSYPVSKAKLKLAKADKDAPEVANDYVERFYDGAPSAPFMINVLANDGEDADPRTLRLVRPPAHGFVVGANVSGAQQLRYTPLNPHRVGWDRFVYEVCSAEGACAQARVDILIHELYVGGTYVRMQAVPANAAVVTEGHFDRVCKLVFGNEVPITCEDVAVIDRVGFSASSTPAGIDVYRGPRTLPPTSVVPAFKAHAVQAPTAVVWHLTAPDSYLFRFKAEMSGPADVAGVYTTAKGRTWFGARGNGDFELGGAGSGLIGKMLQGGQVADEFKGCDRFLGIDTCVKLFGIDFAGSIKRRLDGFFVFAPATETTGLSQSNGAADVEYLPLVTLRARNMTSIKGGVELQLELVPLGPQVEGNLSIKATALKADIWFPGAEAARFAWTTLGPISLPSSYDFNTPIPVIFGPAFDPYN